MPLIGREFLDGISQHRSRHDRSMLIEERFQDRLSFLSDFPQHPACRLVDQVFLVIQQLLADRQRISEIVVSNEILRRNDGDSAFP